jgi:hypothetical protein
MTGNANKIPVVEVHRGVGIHDQQPRQRIDNVVKPAIDEVLATNDPLTLIAYCERCANPPEARLLAAAKVEAMFRLAEMERRVRPAVDLEYVQACVAGLDSQYWRDPDSYGTLVDRDNVRREIPLSDE